MGKRMPGGKLYNSPYRMRILEWRFTEGLTYREILDKLELANFKVTEKTLIRYVKYMKNSVSGERLPGSVISDVAQVLGEVQTDKASVLRDLENKINILEISIEEIQESEMQPSPINPDEQIKIIDYKKKKVIGELVTRIKDIREFMVKYWRSDDINQLLTEFGIGVMDIVFRKVLSKVIPSEREQTILEFKVEMEKLIDSYNDKYETV